MYYYIRGKLVHKDTNFVVVDAGGVGYEIYTTLTDIEKAGETGREITMYTYLSVREDAHILYGFLTQEERKMFLTLTAVSGVGPKAAVSILTAVSPSKLAAAIITDDVKSITKAQGVGPKLAKRIILELRDRIKNADLDTGFEDAGEESVSGGSLSEAAAALVALGYSANEAQKAVGGADSTMSVEEIIKKALARLI